MSRSAVAEKAEKRILASNRRARHDYHLLEKVEAGIVLTGAEVKSARAGKVQLKESYVEIRDGEAWLVGAHISPYSHAGHDRPDPVRTRKLLLRRREIDKLFGKSLLKGQTLVPLAFYLKGDHIKVEVALARGKKLWDKRRAEKEKIARQEMEDAVRRHD